MNWIRITMSVGLTALVASATGVQAFGQVPLLDTAEGPAVGSIDQASNGAVKNGKATVGLTNGTTGSNAVTVPGSGAHAARIGATDDDPDGIATVACLGGTIGLGANDLTAGVGECGGGGSGPGDGDGGDDGGAPVPELVPGLDCLAVPLPDPVGELRLTACDEGADPNGNDASGGDAGDGDGGSTSGADGDSMDDGTPCVVVDQASTAGGGSSGPPLWGSVLLGLTMFGLGALATRRRVSLDETAG